MVLARSSIREELKRTLRDHLALAETHPPEECPLDVRSVAAGLRISRTTLYKYGLNREMRPNNASGKICGFRARPSSNSSTRIGFATLQQNSSKGASAAKGSLLASPSWS